MLKKLFKIIAIFVLGIGGGIFADQILWPYFVERPLFQQYRLEQAPVYVTERNEIIIQENIALQNAIEKTEKSLVTIKTSSSSGEVFRGSGIVITSDGLVLTLAENLSQDGNFIFLVDGQQLGYQILKRDLKANLALVKLDKTGSSAAAFADFGKTKLGERVFLFGITSGKAGLQKIVNEGIIRTFNQDLIQTNISEKTGLKGSPVFNIEGELMGLAQVDSDARVSAISIKQIRDFVGF